jgi:hypothetical protein
MRMDMHLVSCPKTCAGTVYPSLSIRTRFWDRRNGGNVGVGKEGWACPEYGRLRDTQTRQCVNVTSTITRWTELSYGVKMNPSESNMAF